MIASKSSELTLRIGATCRVVLQKHFYQSDDLASAVDFINTYKPKSITIILEKAHLLYKIFQLQTHFFGTQLALHQIKKAQHDKFYVILRSQHEKGVYCLCSCAIPEALKQIRCPIKTVIPLQLLQSRVYAQQDHWSFVLLPDHHLMVWKGDLPIIARQIKANIAQEIKQTQEYLYRFGFTDDAPLKIIVDQSYDFKGDRKVAFSSVVAHSIALTAHIPQTRHYKVQKIVRNITHPFIAFNMITSGCLAGWHIATHHAAQDVPQLFFQEHYWEAYQRHQPVKKKLFQTLAHFEDQFEYKTLFQSVHFEKDRLKFVVKRELTEPEMQQLTTIDKHLKVSANHEIISHLR